MRPPTPAPRLSRTPAALRRGAPAPGQHSEELLREAGFGDEALRALFDQGVVRGAA